MRVLLSTSSLASSRPFANSSTWFLSSFPGAPSKFSFKTLVSVLPSNYWSILDSQRENQVL